MPCIMHVINICAPAFTLYVLCTSYAHMPKTCKWNSLEKELQVATTGAVMAAVVIMVVQVEVEHLQCS